MGIVCSVLCGLIVALVGVAVWRDEWVDDPVRWEALAGGLLIGVGTILHALGVW